MKPNILIATLTSCSGCISTIFSLDIFPQYLEKINLVYCPFLMDLANIVENDIALIEGCVSNEEQIEFLKEIRKKSKKVIALGTCAAYGGILSLSTENQAEPLCNYIEVDEIIPGCSPPSKLLGNCLLRILENKEIILPEKNVCSSCELRGKNGNKFKKSINRIMPNNGEINKENEERHCFLEDGILCLGPITRDGCECECIKFGIPCEGCMGPITEDFTSNAINFLSSINLSNDLRKYKGIFFRFSKPNFKGGSK
jgi:F420-non-reducing hydrogenase small subunit